MDYKLSIHGTNFYKEIKLTKDWSEGLAIGTTKECEMRFARESFNTEFVIEIVSENGQWLAKCSETVCLRKINDTASNMQYFMLSDTVDVCDVAEEKVLFSLEFSIDFINKTPDFNRVISCQDCLEFTIGGADNCTIRIIDPVIAGDYIKFVREGSVWTLDSQKARYGILLNGFPSRQKKLELKDGEMISLNGFSFFWKNQRLYTSVESEVVCHLPMSDKLLQKNHLQYPKFVRSARQQFMIPKEKIEVLSPKGKPEEPKKNLIMSILPMVISMGMMAMMRMTMGGNVMFVVMSIGMCSVSAVIGVINYKNEGKQYKKNLVKRENDYNRYIAEREEVIRELQEKESIISAQKYPSIEEELRFVEDFDARLFEKQKVHEDYLYVRLGEGIIESKCEIGYRKQEYREIDDPLMDYPERLHNKYNYIENMPVMLDLSKANVVGFLGDRTHLYQMSKNLILQFCIEHYYQDVKLYLLMGKEDKRYFEWARWFRNFREENGMRNFGYDENSSKLILEYLYAQLSEREKMRESEIQQLPTSIVFIYRSDLLGEHPVSNYLEKASKLGFVFLFFEEYAEKLNQHCSKRIFLDKDSYTGYVQDIMDGEQIQHFRYARVPADKALEAAVKMSCVYVDEVSLEASLTKNITLYELLGIRNVYELNLSQRWSQSTIYDTMAAPLGVKSGNEIVYLDLHEKYHGPHGLVAGTTGSGKSEILQSYILSMATLFHPYEVGFIIIDFKGGGMVNQFRNLPHLNGAITNIDGKEIERSLLSIKAELRKRQRLFAEYDVNHINDYIRLYKQGMTKQPLPHLILIVDEFAELKSEQPEFMKELISTARIGRSLGVHLILATQKPSGVVNEQIWSNSKFKLCLKVQNQSDSNEVLKSPLAAEIREPGRAYLQVGNNEIFQLFQSAYSGAPVPNGSMGEVKKFEIAKLELNGKREIIYQQKPKEDKGGDTQLDAIVDYVEEYCRVNHIQRLPDICLPSLPEIIPYTLDNYENKNMDVCVPIGMYDDPNNQYQGIMDLNFTQGHTFIVGSSQMGKTNLLQTMIRGIAGRYTSDDVQMYLLDCASKILKNFEGLKHIGDVITYEEEDKLKNFFKMMEEELTKRKDMLSQLGLSSYSAYCESGQREVPQIIIMLDNVGMFRELFSGLDDKLLKLVRDGAALGISLVVTGQQTSSLSHRYLSNFGRRFALYCNDSGEYTSVFDRCRVGLNEVPGRCLFSMNKSIYEGQIYLAFPAEKEIDKVKEIRNFIEQINSKDKGEGAAKISTVPPILTKDMVHSLLSDNSKPYIMPLGMNYENMDIDTINIQNFQLLGISGRNELGRVDFIIYMVEELLANKINAPVNIYIFDDNEQELKSLAHKVQYYSIEIDDIVERIELLYQELVIRKGKENNKEPLEYIIINNEAVYEKIGKEEKLLELCKECLIKYPECKFAFVLTKIANANLKLEASPFIKILNRACNLIIFEQVQDILLFEPGIKAKKKYTVPLLKNEMYFKCGEYFGKYKLISNEYAEISN